MAETWRDSLATYEREKHSYQSTPRVKPCPKPELFDPILGISIAEKQIELRKQTEIQKEKDRTARFARVAGLAVATSAVGKSSDESIVHEKAKSNGVIIEKGKSFHNQVPALNLNSIKSEREEVTKNEAKIMKAEVLKEKIATPPLRESYENKPAINETQLQWQRAQEKFKKWKVFDPIKGTYVNEELEAACTNTSRSVVVQKQAAYYQKLPLSVRNSEGRIYNITSVEQIKDKEKLEALLKGKQEELRMQTRKFFERDRQEETRRLKEIAKKERLDSLVADAIRNKISTDCISDYGRSYVPPQPEKLSLWENLAGRKTNNTYLNPIKIETKVLA